MTNELLALFEYYEKEKGIDRETMVEALENALLSASKKSIGPARELAIHVNPEKGTIKATAQLVVVEAVKAPYDEIDLATAERIQPGAQLDDEIEVEVTPKDMGRIAAQTAKQAMMQRLRQAEKEMIYDEFKDRAGDIVGGSVRRFERSDVMIDLGKFEGVMPSRERVSTEEYNVGDRLRAYVVAVENGVRGPEIILSRSHPNFVRRLFEAEVSEIADRTVEIRGIAREAGYRTKVAVHSTAPKVDPVGACVGLRGARVKNIVRELNNEKVDIIRYSDNVREFVEEALKPAKILSIELDEEEKRVRVTVDEEELSKAIGRRGQNARLTSRLVGWDVQVEKDESAREAVEARVAEAASGIAEAVGISEESALDLVREGITGLELLATGVDAEDVAEMLGIEEGEAAQIVARAQAAFGSDDGAEQGEDETAAPADDSAGDEAVPEPEAAAAEKEEAEEEQEAAPEAEAEAAVAPDAADEADEADEEAPAAGDDADTESTSTADEDETVKENEEKEAGEPAAEETAVDTEESAADLVESSEAKEEHPA